MCWRTSLSNKERLELAELQWSVAARARSPIRILMVPCLPDSAWKAGSSPNLTPTKRGSALRRRSTHIRQHIREKSSFRLAPPPAAPDRS